MSLQAHFVAQHVNWDAISVERPSEGIERQMVVIPDTPHPFWLFHPWFDQTVAHVEEFLKRTL